MIFGDFTRAPGRALEMSRAGRGRVRRVAELLVLVPIVLAAAWLLPAQAGPMVSPEAPVTGPLPALAAHDQFGPRAAWNGAIWLLAWTDNRAGTPDVYAARVSASGEVLDPNGIPIATGAGRQAFPAVASDGSGFLVAWEDLAPTGESRIVASRVGPDGVVLDLPGTTVASGTGRRAVPAAAWGNGAYLVAWEDHRCGSFGCGEILAARMAPSGTLLDSAPIVAAEDESVLSLPAVDSDGQDWLLVWEGGPELARSISGARLTASGTVEDGAPIAISPAGGFARSPAAAWNGTAHLVVWEDRSCGSAGCADIVAARVSVSGAVLDPDGLAVSSASGPQSLPSIVPVGAVWLVLWSDARSGTGYDVYAARVLDDASVVDPLGLPVSTVSGAQFAPVAAWNGQELLCAWEDDRCGSVECADIYATRLEADGDVLDPAGVAVSGSAPAQTTPAVASDGASFLVVWEEDRQGQIDLFGARFSSSGEPLDEEAFPISTAPGDQLAPAIAWDGEVYLVVWEDHRCGSEFCSDLYAARVAASGAVLDPTGILVSGAAGLQFGPAVSAGGGGGFLAAWLDARSGLAAFVARVGADGSVSDPEGIRVASYSDGHGYPAVASDGSGWIVATVAFDPQTSYDVFASRVSAEGQVLDDPPIRVCGAPSVQSAPVVTWDGGNFFFSWEDFRSNLTSELFGARVSPSGAVLDPAGILLSASSPLALLPTAAWDGSNHQVVWQDGRAATAFDLFAARVSAAGVVVPQGSTGLALSASPASEDSPRAAPVGTGRVAVVYSRFSDAPEERAQRVYVRLLSECMQDGAAGGSECPFALVSPPDDASLPALSIPTFWWGEGSLAKFRVEFSPFPDFSRKRVKSRAGLAAGSSYTPDAKKWNRIKSLAPPGEPIYWRVVGKPLRSAQKSTSPAYSFVVPLGP